MEITMNDFIILILLLIILLLSRRIYGGVRIKGRIGRYIKHFQTINNPGLEFSFPYNSSIFSKTQKIEIRKVLKWPKSMEFELEDIISLLPKEITPPIELRDLFDKEDFKPRKYYLNFDSDLKPYYYLWGFEGVDDTLPYSEYGNDDWFRENGWERTRPKTPEDLGECYVRVIKFLVDYKFVKV